MAPKTLRTLGWAATAAIVGIAAYFLTLGRQVIGDIIYPVPADEYGDSAYQLLSETPVRPYPEAVEVRLFVETDEDRQEFGVLVPANGRLLSPEERTGFEALLTKRSTRGGVAHACFVPHHFFRYYDASGHQIGTIAICFCCQGAAAEPALFPPEGGYFQPYSNALGFDPDRLAAFVEGLGLPAHVWCRERSVAETP